MTVVSDLLSSLDHIEARSREQNDRISAALLHIRARELLQQSRHSILASIVIAWFTATVMQVGALLAFPISHTGRFIVVCLFAATGLYIGNSTDNLAVLSGIYGFVIGYLIVNPKMTIGTIKAFFFDVADIVSYGTLTKAVAKFLIEGRENAARRMLRHKESTILPEPIAVHFYASRHAFKRVDQLKAQEDKLLNLIMDTTDNNVISSALEEYWTSI